MSQIKVHREEIPFLLESGESIDQLKIAYSTWGQINGEGSNVVWVFHALTANSVVTDWWPGLFGDEQLFDPKEHFIICANVIGSPYGSSSPENLAFPQFTVRDVVNAHLLLKQKLGIKKVFCAIGGSFGGNQALEFAYSLQNELERLILIASCSRESAWGIAIHEAQRIALKADSTFGNFDGGSEGLKAARAIGMLTYRTNLAFESAQTDLEEKTDNFKAASYIQYQGDKFNNRFNALSYYYLTKCLDSHHIGRSRGGEEKALNQISAKTLIIGISADQLIPVHQQKKMAEHIPNSTYVEIQSDFGHDGFLLEYEQLTQHITPFIQ